MPTGTPAGTPENRKALGYVKRPNSGAEPCVSGMDGRYEIPSSTPSAAGYFTRKRRDFQTEPRSDAPVPHRKVN